MHMQEAGTIEFTGTGPWSLTVESGRAEIRDRTALLAFNFVRKEHAANYLYVELTLDEARTLADSLYTALQQTGTG
jgi:hypothetical protein